MNDEQLKELLYIGERIDYAGVSLQRHKDGPVQSAGHDLSTAGRSLQELAHDLADGEIK